MKMIKPKTNLQQLDLLITKLFSIQQVSFTKKGKKRDEMPGQSVNQKTPEKNNDIWTLGLQTLGTESLDTK